MGWTAINTQQAIAEGGFSVSEKSALVAAAGADAGTLDDVLNNVVLTLRGVISAAGGTLGDDNTVPDSLRMDVVALTRWRWLIAFPALKQYQTKERETAALAAETRFDAVAAGERPVEAPAAGTFSGTGNSGSDTQLAMRGNAARVTTET
jgi:hypothetical protein